MRLVVKNYGDCTIYSERPFGYKRFIVEWDDHTEVFSGLWYNEIDVRDTKEYPSLSLTTPQKTVDNSWKIEESKNFTVAPAYNKGAYQVIPRSDVEHIGK